MLRIKRYWMNAGILSSIITFGISLLLLLILFVDLRTDNWKYTLPVLIVAVTFSYLIRNVLVENFHISRIVLNVIAISLAISVPVVKQFVDPESLPIRIAVFAVLGTFLSSFFWLMSDERVYSTR